MKNLKKNVRVNAMQNIAASYLLAAFLLGFGSCSQKKTGTTDENNLPAAEENDYRITRSQFLSEKMELGGLEIRNFHHSVNANGLFDVPPKNRASVSTHFAGYVRGVLLLPGQKVEKGQVLFTLENLAYVQIQQEFLVIKEEMSYLKSDYERQKILAKDSVTSQKKYLKAKTDYAITRVKYESLKKKLSLMNINPDNLSVETISTTIPVLSPLSGYVREVNITNGLYLNPADIAVSITDITHLHLELSIFAKDLHTVAIGQPIKFKVVSDAAMDHEATVHLINKFVDMENRTAIVHGHLTDEKELAQFSPGMYVEAEIYTSSQSKYALPQEAVVDIDGKYFVLVKREDSDDIYVFEKKQIQSGKSTGGYLEILNYEAF
ncbi:efflux RND transporter periplasmic adaptor subunit [Reichenbachiella sp.]